MSELLGRRRIQVDKEPVRGRSQPSLDKESTPEHVAIAKGEIKLTKITVIRADGTVEEIDHG